MKKILIPALLFTAFLVLASFLYGRLGKNLSTDNLVDMAPKNTEAPSSQPAPAGEAEAPGDAALPEKNAAPDFTVYDAGGAAVKLSDHLGQPVIVNFWASWCPPCKSEMPHFDKAHETFGEDIVFMMIDMVDGSRETAEDGRQYLLDSGYQFPSYFDTDQDAAYTYGVSSIPATYFIDAEGFLVAGAKGALDEKTLQRGIDMLLTPGEDAR